ncbi:3700_t:CDS:2, partial [Entrophospora sp. SA101]
MWDAVRNTLIKTAEKTIPKLWVSESFKDIKSKELIKNYSYLRKVNKILIIFNNIKIYNDKIPSQTEWDKDIKILNNIINNEEDKWREAQIKFFSLKRCNNFNLEKGKYISSCLERSKRKITLDKIIIETKDGLELITNSNTIKNQWKRQYEPLNFINDKWYKYIMQPPTFEEWYKLVKSLPNNKAAGPSKITNEMIKYAGQNINKAVWRLVCACLKCGDIPNEWREAVIYPIPKPQEWEGQLKNTQPITLLETVRKGLVKLVYQRLSMILAKKKILKGGNYAGLPGGSCYDPIHILENIIHDTKNKNQEIWILCQDISKAYDCVNINMLNKAMERIKLPPLCRKFIINLFSRRTNTVITQYGNTDPYQILVGIDQGEVISPLLWVIYYDPLLCELNNNVTEAYSINHTWINNLDDKTINKIEHKINNLTYMDDSNLISKSKLGIENYMKIADEFYEINNIKVNKNKYMLISNQCKSGEEIILNNNTKIKATGAKESFRFLGVWFNLDQNKKYVKNQVKQEIYKTVNIMKYKRLTDKQLVYIFNSVVLPKIEYKLQTTVLTPNEANDMMKPYRKLFKNRLGISKDTPNLNLSNKKLYNLIDLHHHQSQCHINSLFTKINNPNTLGKIIEIRLHQLQTEMWIPHSPLSIKSWNDWLSSKKLKNDLIAAELNLMQQNHINIKHHNEESFSIKGGNTPLYTILKESYYKNTAPLKNRLIMFLDQLRSYDGSYLLTWKEITDKHFNKKKFSRKPKWMESLETSVLLNTNSQKLKPQWPSMTNNVQEIQIPLMNNRKKEWIGAWPTCGSELVLGRIEKKSKNNKIRIEHWNHLIQNIGTTPTSNPPILIQCHGCKYSIPQEIQNSGNCHFWCESNSAIV